MLYICILNIQIMITETLDKSLIGKRIRLNKFGTIDPFPLCNGNVGTIYWVGLDVINVEWDNGRKLGLIVGVDDFTIFY